VSRRRAGRLGGMAVVLTSDLRCPECAHAPAQTMPTSACVIFHQCSASNALTRPKAGDGGVLCSYGSVPFPLSRAV
jgi:hypothetical protein